MNPVRIVSFLAGLALLVLLPAAQQAPSDLDPRQIQWQRSLEDAAAMSSLENRPLFVAINVDGESASDRIVDEVYRDPRFVQWTRRFACVVASVSRHNPRDHDERGRRILCPRLGNVTCGEHIALEPIVFTRHLGGERVSPRHALVMPDGKKAVDLALQWDWSDLERAVEAAAANAPEPAALPELPHSPQQLAPTDPRLRVQLRPGQWRSLAATRTAFGRDAFEKTVDGLPSEALCFEALGAIAEAGDAGMSGVLRIFLARTPPPSTGLIERVGSTAAAIRAGPRIVSIVEERLARSDTPGATGLDDERRLLPLLARFDAQRTATRSKLLAQWAIGSELDRRAAGAAIGPHLALEEPSRCAAAIEAEGGPVQLGELLQLSRVVGAVTRGAPLDATPDAGAPAGEAPRTLDDLDAEMRESDTLLSANREDPAAQARFGRAALALARHYVESGGGNALLYLEDARMWLARAAETRPDDRELAFDRARTAWLMGRFDEQERIAIQAFGGFGADGARSATARAVADADGLGDPDHLPEGDVRRALTLLDDDARIEALRWLGDAAARLVGTRAGGPPADEIAGFVRAARALAMVAVSARSDETDWVSLASFLGLVGLQRDALAAWQAGVERLPTSNVLRDGLNRALAAAARTDLAPAKADWIASQHPTSGACAWYAGYAWMLAAEQSRRAQEPDAAIAAYGNAHARFDRCLTLAPEYAESSRHFIGMAALGRGFAHVQAGRRGEGINALVDGVAASTSVLAARDGLDREVPDLVDALLEWKAGTRSPVDPVALAARLLEAVPATVAPALAVADAQLREARRADHRGQSGGSPEDEVRAVPGPEGDEYMRDSIASARLAFDHVRGGRLAEAVPDDEGGAEAAMQAASWQLSQSLTYHAERLIARGDDDDARGFLREAAGLQGVDAPEEDANAAAWRALAASLRAKLGPAEPIARPGR